MPVRVCPCLCTSACVPVRVCSCEYACARVFVRVLARVRAYLKDHWVLPSTTDYGDQKIEITFTLWGLLNRSMSSRTTMKMFSISELRKRRGRYRRHVTRTDIFSNIITTPNHDYDSFLNIAAVSQICVILMLKKSALYLPCWVVWNNSQVWIQSVWIRALHTLASHIASRGYCSDWRRLTILITSHSWQNSKFAQTRAQSFLPWHCSRSINALRA